MSGDARTLRKQLGQNGTTLWSASPRVGRASLVPKVYTDGTPSMSREAHPVAGHRHFGRVIYGLVALSGGNKVYIR